jgi:putative DNA primase/helicase
VNGRPQATHTQSRPAVSAFDRGVDAAMEAGDALDGIAGIIQIEGDGDQSRVCDEVVHLLVQASAPIYQRGGMLVHVVEDGSRLAGLTRDTSAPRIVPLDALALADLITRNLALWRRNRKTQELVRVDCPLVIAQTILARKQWSFRRLEAVVEHPVMLPSGEVLWESQYHEPTGLLLRLPYAGFMAPAKDPAEYEVHTAQDELCNLLAEFPFVDDTDLSVALAFLMTAFVRPVLPTCPGFAIDAHAAGSGKSTLVRTQSRLATGREPAFLTYSDDPAELKKLLFAALLEGDQNIAIDNVDITLQSAVLAIILTSSVYRDRVLGLSANASVPTKAVISFNGNNLQIVGDLTRRVLVCRLDPSCERPAEREFNADPIKQAMELRGAFVDSALTIMSGYIAAGERVKLRPFGSFEEWSRLVREPLVWLGLPDPVDSIRVLEAADPERAQLHSMLTAVNAAYEFNEFKAASLVHAAKAKAQASIDGGGAALTPDQAADLSEALHAVCERNGELNAKSLGRWFLRVRGRIDGGLRFVQGRQTNTGAMWRVERAE